MMYDAVPGTVGADSGERVGEVKGGRVGNQTFVRHEGWGGGRRENEV